MAPVVVVCSSSKTEPFIELHTYHAPAHQSSRIGHFRILTFTPAILGSDGDWIPSRLLSSQTLPHILLCPIPKEIYCPLVILTHDVIRFVPLNTSSHEEIIVVNDGLLDTKIVGAKLKSAIETSVILISKDGVLVFWTYHVRGSSLYQVSHEITLVQLLASPLVLPTITYCPSVKSPRAWSVIVAHDEDAEVIWLTGNGESKLRPSQTTWYWYVGFAVHMVVIDHVPLVIAI